MRKPLLLVLVTFLAFQAAGEVQYSIDADASSLEKNSTVRLDCSATSCPGLTWQLTSAEQVVEVRGSGGSVDYEVEGETLSIPGERLTGRDERTLRIRTVIQREAEEVHAGLYKRTLQLSGFPGERTTGTVRVEDLASGWTGFGVEESFTGDEMRFRGTGPVNIRVKFGKGYDTRYFSFFGARPGDTQISYEVPIGTTGVVQKFERFPVAVMDDETYDRKVNRWSAGEYVGGAIQIRSPGSIRGSFRAVLAHEVVHGLNDRLLNWDQTRSSYFDEGTGKYVEFLVQKKLYREGRIDRPPAELFGDPVRYDPDPSDRSYYTIRSKGDRDVLWNYYQEDRDFMKTWNAMEAGEDVRDFGYAYSELIIRNYVARMDGSLRELYGNLELDRRIQQPDEKWEFYSQHVDMTPCEYSSRDRFEQCLETINDYSYPVYSAQPTRNEEPLNITELEVPDRPETGGLSATTSSLSSFVQGFLDYLASLLG